MNNNEYARYFNLDKYTKGEEASYAYKEMASTIREVSETYNNVKGMIIYEAYQDLANNLDTLSVLSKTLNTRIEKTLDLRLLVNAKLEKILSNIEDVYYGDSDVAISNDKFQGNIILHYFN